jgi:four helix bundle protein
MEGEMNEVRSFEDLKVWQEGVEVADLTFEITEGFTNRVSWSLGTQMERSSVSVASNIAEGCERQHTQEYIQFCYVALGSLAELHTQVVIARRRKFVTEEKAGKLILKIGDTRRMARNLVKSLKARKLAGKNAIEQ